MWRPPVSSGLRHWQLGKLWGVHISCGYMRCARCADTLQDTRSPRLWRQGVPACDRGARLCCGTLPCPVPDRHLGRMGGVLANVRRWLKDARAIPCTAAAWG